MNKNFNKIVSMVLLLAMVLSVVVIVPVAAADLQPLEEGKAFIVCRTVDEEGNETNIALYAPNQKVIFELRAYNFALQPVAVAGFNYSLFADGSGKGAIETGFVEADPETGIALVEATTMSQPGLFRLTANIADAEKNTLSGYNTIPAGVLVDAQAITMNTSPIPAEELRQVWDEQLALQVAPEILKITKIESKSTATHDVYAIYIDSIGNPDDITRPDGLAEDAVGPQTGATHAFAHLSVPTGAAAGSLNLAVNVQGYGVSSGYAATWSASTITLSLSAHSLEAIEGTDVTDFKSYYTSWIQGGGSYGFDKDGLTTNVALETCYFRNMLLRDVNGVLFCLEAFGDEGATISAKYDETAPRTMAKSELESLIASWKGLLKPEGERVVEISGGSQGGFQAIGVAAILDDEITVCKSQITWLADVTSNLDTSNIPCGFRPYPTKAEGEERSALEYVDSANMAQLIKCETIVSPIRLGDLTSPPTGVMAMYNNLTHGKAETDGPFSIKFVQGVSHGHSTFTSDSTVQKSIETFINNYCTATIEGALAPKIDSWSIENGVLTVNASGIIDSATGDALWEADPMFATVDSIVLSEGIVSIGANAFDVEEAEVTLKLPSTVKAIADGAFGADADLTKYTIRSYNDTYAQAYAEKNGANFVTLGDISASTAYAYSVEGSVLNLVSTGDIAVLTADATLCALALANAETIKTIEIEGKFAAIGSLEAALKNFTRVENIKIDVQSTSLAEDATNVFANAANLTSLGHVEFDAMGAPVADSGTYKKGEVSLEGFMDLYGVDGILSGDRAVTSVVVPGTSIPARAFENNTSLETVYLLEISDTAHIAADAFTGTSGVTIIVADEVAKISVEDVLAEAGIDNVTVSLTEEEEGSFGDKTGAAGTAAKWKIKGSTLIISGTGAVTKLEGFA
ncbi:MAG: leucine-rich repeat protein, partial [Oscillospiraceae bacterium]|nr:leucine-rich repeat protein [Oscillospiraceae bacterium]